MPLRRYAPTLYWQAIEARNLSRKGFCRNPRGIFPTEFPGECCRGFFGGFFRPFFLGKKRRKNPPKNPRQFSNQNLGVSGPKSTLQGSGLDNLFVMSQGRNFVTVILPLPVWRCGETMDWKPDANIPVFATPILLKPAQKRSRTTLP